MQKIIPHLWFETGAKEVAEFYVRTFGGNSSIVTQTTLRDTPSGDCDVVTFRIRGTDMVTFSARSAFRVNPSISFTVPCATVEEVDGLYSNLVDGGKTLMELNEYPFSKRYGWIQDKYGVSWQIILAADGIAKKISPHLMFTKSVYGRAEEAINFYLSVFHNSKVLGISRYPANMEPDREGTIIHALFQLEDQEFGVLDSAREHEFTFNEAISLLISCDDQAEIDYYWGKLTDGGQELPCGWVKDKFGVFWQIAPACMAEMMQRGTPEQTVRVTKAFLKMKKFDILTLQRAYEST